MRKILPHFSRNFAKIAKEKKSPFREKCAKNRHITGNVRCGKGFIFTKIAIILVINGFVSKIGTFLVTKSFSFAWNS